MTIIVTKPGIIIDVVGSYFYDKKSWQKMVFSSWAGQRPTAWHSLGRSWRKKPWSKQGRGKYRGSSQLRWWSGAEWCTFLSYVCVIRLQRIYNFLLFHAIIPSMSQVIDDATFSMNDTHDDHYKKKTHRDILGRTNFFPVMLMTLLWRQLWQNPVSS